MMDVTSLYPQGFHPVRLDQLPQHLRRTAPIRSRADIAVAYYLVTFGISPWFQLNETNRLGLLPDVPKTSLCRRWSWRGATVLLVSGMTRWVSGCRRELTRCPRIGTMSIPKMALRCPWCCP